MRTISCTSFLVSSSNGEEFILSDFDSPIITVCCQLTTELNTNFSLNSYRFVRSNWIGKTVLDLKILSGRGNDSIYGLMKIADLPPLVVVQGEKTGLNDGIFPEKVHFQSILRISHNFKHQLIPKALMSYHSTIFPNFFISP